MAPDVVADPTSNINQEMVVTCEVVTGKGVGAEREIEASALPADSRQELKSSFLTQFGLIHGIEIQNNRTERLTARSTVRTLARFPGSLKIEADTPVKNYVGIDVWVQAALFRNQTAGETTSVRSIGHDGTESGLAVEQQLRTLRRLVARARGQLRNKNQQ